MSVSNGVPTLIVETNDQTKVGTSTFYIKVSLDTMVTILGEVIDRTVLYERINVIVGLC